MAMSDLSKKIDKLDQDLRKKDGSKRSEEYNRLVELSSLVFELSRKIDRIAGDTEPSEY